MSVCRRRKRDAPRLTKARFSAMVEQATVDAYLDAEQITGWFTLIEENLTVPFETLILGVPVTVERVDLTRSGRIVGICARGRARQIFSILDLPLRMPLPKGADWIEAYRRWYADRHSFGGA